MDAVEKVLRVLSEGPKTTDEVARQLGVSWATANGLLLQLAGKGKVKHVRKGRVNVFLLNQPGRLRFNVPSWAKPRKLRELADELEEYFEDVPAFEMVRRERRG
ncbi:MAG: hypothetical protein ACTSWP_09110 [Candidatus Freyarchaeota archaeon]